MEDIVGKNVTHSVFDNPDWGEKGAQVIFEIVKKGFSKKCRIANHMHNSNKDWNGCWNIILLTVFTDQR